jgi:hypothetical protein
LYFPWHCPPSPKRATLQVFGKRVTILNETTLDARKGEITL